MTKHKHCEVTKAWADGAKIEFREDFLSPWTYTAHPGFSEDYEYRVKPEPVVDYTVVNAAGYPGTSYCSLLEDLEQFYDYTSWCKENRQGYMKRTMLDGKVVSFEFIPK